MSVKSRMHPRNIYNRPPDFKELAISYPEFRKHVKQELNGRLSIDYGDPRALKELTRTLLQKDFNLDVDIDESRLIPRVPICLNYILWIEDLLLTLEEKRPDKPFGIDIGTGGACIYSLLAAKKGWKMLATELDEINFKNAENNVMKNNLEDVISLKLVSNSDRILEGVIDEQILYDFCMCNPPFFDFNEKPQNRTSRRRQLGTTASKMSTEISTKGGEFSFLSKLIQESGRLQGQVKIFTTLIGKKWDFICLRRELRKCHPKSVVATEFCQGRTMRWGLAWTFLDINLRTNSGPSRMKSKKSKSKPLQFALPYYKKEKLNAVIHTTKALLTALKIKFSEEMSNPSIVICIEAYINTWSHQRQKKRLLARTGGEPRIDKGNLENSESHQYYNESDNEECSEPKRQKLKTNKMEETYISDKPIVEASMIFKTVESSIIVEMFWISGCKENFHQIFQYFKNYWKRSSSLISD